MPVPDEEPGPSPRHNLLIAATLMDAVEAKRAHPGLRTHTVATPRSIPGGMLAGAIVWTPAAADLPAATRLKLRGQLAPCVDEFSTEEKFPTTTPRPGRL